MASPTRFWPQLLDAIDTSLFCDAETLEIYKDRCGGKKLEKLKFTELTEVLSKIERNSDIEVRIPRKLPKHEGDKSNAKNTVETKKESKSTQKDNTLNKGLKTTAKNADKPFKETKNQKTDKFLKDKEVSQQNIAKEKPPKAKAESHSAPGTKTNEEIQKKVSEKDYTKVDFERKPDSSTKVPKKPNKDSEKQLKTKNVPEKQQKSTVNHESPGRTPDEKLSDSKKFEKKLENAQKTKNSLERQQKSKKEPELPTQEPKKSDKKTEKSSNSNNTSERHQKATMGLGKEEPKVKRQKIEPEDKSDLSNNLDNLSSISKNVNKSRAPPANMKIEFSRVKFKDQEKDIKNPTAGKDYKMLLKKSREFKQSVEELKKEDLAKGQAKEDKHHISCAIKKAAGVKIKDNVQKLKKAAQDKERRKQKSKAKAEQREKNLVVQKAEKQKKRAQNIAARRKNKF